MPKSAKKKKEKVADFSKAKLKLGKGKATPSNAIDTSFKARSIFLPSQSIAIDKDAAQPTTRRQLTFTDLISHLRHYNAGTRKDALLGLRELFEAHWEIAPSSLTPLVNALVKLFSDEDGTVRKQLILFLSWLLPQISPEDLLPHAPLVLLFITSAQTHIFPEIRIDAIRCLDILLECVPEVVVGGWNENNGGHGARVLEGYLGILNAGTKYGETAGPLKATSTASVVLTAASKCTVLKSLAKFLETALQADSRTDGEKSPSDTLDAWFLETAFRSVEDFDMFEQRFSIPNGDQRKQLWQPRSSTDEECGDLYANNYPVVDGFLNDESWAIADIVLAVHTSSQNVAVASENTAFISHLANTLHSTMIETYLDVAPSVFSPGSSPSDTEVQLVVTVARIVRTLYYPILRSKQNIEALHLGHLESIVNYMSTYFPVTGRNTKFDSIYEEVNLIYCELIALLVNASPRNEKRSSSKKTPRTGALVDRSKLSIQTGRVMEYITRRLRGEAASPSQIAVPINARAYLACLPTIWAFISNNPSSDVIHAVLDHALKTTSKSPCKGPTVEFVGRLALLGLDPRCICNLGLNQDADISGKVEAWILHLPQVLWELGSSNLSLTQTILCVLLRILQSNSKGAQGPPSEMIESLQSRLIPYFYMDHPIRGAILGPYKKLPAMETCAGWGDGIEAPLTASCSRVRLLALDVVVCVMNYSSTRKGIVGRRVNPNGSTAQKEEKGAATEALNRAVGEAVSGEAEEDYWIHVSQHAPSFK